MDFMKEYEKWLASPALSDAERAELESIRNDPKEIESRFYGPLEFGTAGLRGIMAVGLHNMNIHVIRWATQGFAQVICAEGEEGKRRGVAICMDCRNHSMEFARAAAEVCAANGIHVRIFESLRPTPELSFAVRYYRCQAGINVTASHNPKEYNGYKVYWVVFLENYRVSLAEQLMPASEVSQQISTAGKEASGTGNMKFMMNGALTVGTLDGANVEMHDLLGDENMFLFGLRADEVERLKKEGYVPQRLYNRDPVLHRCLDALRSGFRDGVRYDDLYQRLLFGAGGSPADEYFLLADFQAYCQAEKRMAETYRDQTAWNRMSLHNIARSGVFAADRAVAEYADNIWHVPHK